MPRFMLDTDISSYVMKRSSAPVLDRLRETAVAEVCVSVITKAELLSGVELSPRPEKDRAALEAFLLHVETLESKTAPQFITLPFIPISNVEASSLAPTIC